MVTRVELLEVIVGTLALVLGKDIDAVTEGDRVPSEPFLIPSILADIENAFDVSFPCTQDWCLRHNLVIRSNWRVSDLIDHLQRLPELQRVVALAAINN